MQEKIVICRNVPCLVLGETADRKRYILRSAGKMMYLAPKECVEPYTGDKDAVALGLKDAPREAE